MEKRKLTIIYCYGVCLITLIAFLLSAPAFIRAWYDSNDPFHALSESADSKLLSFENFQTDLRQKLDRREYWKIEAGDGGWKIYKAACDARIASIQHEARRTQLSSGLVGSFCIVLFFVHLFWVHRLRA